MVVTLRAHDRAGSDRDHTAPARSPLADTAAARQGYRTVLALWRDADPELQPLVAEARAALARLGWP